MVTKTVARYVFFEDILKIVNHKEQENRGTSDTEIPLKNTCGHRYRICD